MSVVRCAPTVTVIAVLLAVSATNARAAKTDVFPGNGTLQAAIDAASPGDTLILHSGPFSGTYSGPVVVDKDGLTLRIAGDFPVTGVQIDADCAAPIALDIAADGIRVLGGIRGEGRHGDAGPHCQPHEGEACGCQGRGW